MDMDLVGLFLDFFRKLLLGQLSTLVSNLDMTFFYFLLIFLISKLANICRNSVEIKQQKMSFY